jgi:hypothetical protein
MGLNFDRNLFTQIGLDSGSLTMLGSIVHGFEEPGEYRGSVHRAGGGEAAFYITVDKDSPAAHADIDLASLREYRDAPRSECCDESKENRFAVNTKGYALFRVSSGSGGFSLHLRRAAENPEEKVFNSQELGDGDVFSAVILRPGTYSVVNRLAKSKAEVIVPYPEVGKTAYRPPEPVRVHVGREGFKPSRVELKPGQGLLFDVEVPARIVIGLLRPDDGPGDRRQRPPRGWSKRTLPAR